MTRWMDSVGWGTSRRHRTWPVAVALLGGVMASLLVITPGPAAADSTWVVRGPAATGSPSSFSLASSVPLEAVVRRGDDGAVTLGVTRGGTQVMVPAPIGIRTRQADLTRGLSLRGRTDREVVEHYTTRVGNRLSHSAGPVETDGSNGESAAGDGATITLGGVRHGKGIGMAAPGQVSVALDGRCGEFTAEVGVEDEVDGRVDRAQSGGTVGFVVEGDGAVLAQTGTLTSTGAAERLTVDVRGVDVLTLRLTDGGDGTSLDHGSWGDARLRCANS